MHKSQFPLLSHMARIVFAVPAASSKSERVFSMAGNTVVRFPDLLWDIHGSRGTWLGTLWLLRGPAWRHPRWSSWSPLRPTLGCFDSMEARSRFVLKMAFWILTKNTYDTLSTVAWDLLDLIDFTMNLIFLLLGMIYIAKVSHFHFLDIGIIGKRRSICTTRYSAE